MAAVTKEDFDKFMEDFRGLQVQVAAQHETIKKFTDGLTLSEGAVKEQLEARLADAMQEMGNRVEETKEKLTNEIQNETKKIIETTVPGLLQTHMLDAKAQCRQFISDNNKAITEQLEKVNKIEEADKV